MGSMGIFLIMGHAGFLSSTVCPVRQLLQLPPEVATAQRAPAGRNACHIPPNSLWIFAAFKESLELHSSNRAKNHKQLEDHGNSHSTFHIKHMPARRIEP